MDGNRKEDDQIQNIILMVGGIPRSFNLTTKSRVFGISQQSYCKRTVLHAINSTPTNVGANKKFNF